MHNTNTTAVKVLKYQPKPEYLNRINHNRLFCPGLLLGMLVGR